VDGLIGRPKVGADSKSSGQRRRGSRAGGVGKCEVQRYAFGKKPQMSSDEFKAALREAGVDHGRIVDVSGRCPGFATLPSFNKGVLNRNATLSKVIWERDAEIKRRAAEVGRYWPTARAPSTGGP
jgi:hypothetical protein